MGEYYDKATILELVKVWVRERSKACLNGYRSPWANYGATDGLRAQRKVLQELLAYIGELEHGNE